MAGDFPGVCVSRLLPCLLLCCSRRARDVWLCLDKRQSTKGARCPEQTGEGGMLSMLQKFNLPDLSSVHLRSFKHSVKFVKLTLSCLARQLNVLAGNAATLSGNWGKRRGRLLQRASGTTEGQRGGAWEREERSCSSAEGLLLGFFEVGSAWPSWPFKIDHNWLKYIAGWWFGTFFIFPYWKCHHPNWRTHIFQRDLSKHRPDRFPTAVICLDLCLQAAAPSGGHGSGGPPPAAKWWVCQWLGFSDEGTPWCGVVYHYDDDYYYIIIIITIIIILIIIIGHAAENIWNYMMCLLFMFNHSDGLIYHGFCQRWTSVVSWHLQPRKCGWKFTIKPFQGKCTVSRGTACGGVCVQK